jgi:transglutaminase-like putative cysteine protease
MQGILAAIRREIEHRRDGKSLTLDVLRSRQGKSIGIERVFTTSLRCAGIPARMVEGINLKSSTRRKRVFWTEVWAQGRWWPVSASGGWTGRVPRHYLALARDGARVVEVEGPVEMRYGVQGFGIGEGR